MATNSSTIMNISRDWKPGMAEFAVVGYDYEPPNPLAPWIVTVGRTASGKSMVRANEPTIELSVRHFETSREASDWSTANGYS